MSRKPYYDPDLSLSTRILPSSKDYNDSCSYKKMQREFDKFSSQVLDRNISRQDNYKKGQNDFSSIRKLPDSISNIRQTFSFNPISSASLYEAEQSNSYRRQKPSKLGDTLRQTMDIRAVQRNNEHLWSKSIYGQLPANERELSRSGSTISQQPNSRHPSLYESTRQQTKCYSHINKLYEQRPYSIEQEIRKIREQNSQKQPGKWTEPQYEAPVYVKSYSNLGQLRPKDNFAKKNYVEYYTPKVEKSHYDDRLTNDSGNNVLSPQYDSKINKETSFDQTPKSPTKPNHQKKCIKSIKVAIQNRSANKKSKLSKVSIDDFQIGKSLGHGRFGTAHMAFHKALGAIFAIKKIKKQVIKSNKMIDQFILQVKLQSYFAHPFILKIYGIFDDQTYIYLVLEFMQQGSLFNYLKKFKKLSEQDTAEKVKYLAESIKYLQDRGIAHRDIKPENIIMTNEVCKLADFGWATFCDQQRRKTYCGTCDYVAPEILQGQQYDQTVDLWCIGVLAYQLMTGKAPFYHMSMKQTKKKIMNVSLSYPEQFSDNLKSFISGLIQKDPLERMSIEEVLAHPFLRNIKLCE